MLIEKRNKARMLQDQLNATSILMENTALRVDLMGQVGTQTAPNYFVHLGLTPDPGLSAHEST